MKNPFITLGALSIISTVSAISAYADNAGVENAIKSQPNLSDFYEALVDSGVNHELNSHKSYTVFAPTNEVLDDIRQDKYPCSYSAKCRAQVAEIIRSHIIPGKIHIKDAVKHEGGLYSLSGRFVNIGEPSKDDYAVDGNNILFMSSFSGGILYKIDGIIITPQEFISLKNAEYMAALPEEVTTIAKKTIPDPACGPPGCPDVLTKTTTITRAVAESSVATAPMLTPER